jgi:hypothetical protein
MPYNQHNVTSQEDSYAQIFHGKELYESSPDVSDWPDEDEFNEALRVITSEQNEVLHTEHHRQFMYFTYLHTQTTHH